MAKKKNGGPEDSAIDDAVDRITVYYDEVGREAAPEEFSGIVRPFSRIASKYECSTADVRKAAEFRQRFSPQDVKDICKLCKKHAFPIDIEHVFRVLSIEPRERALALLRQAIIHQWDLERLNRNVLAAGGDAKKAGRPKDLPTGTDAAKEEIINRLSPELLWLRDLSKHKKGALVAGIDDEVAAVLSSLQNLMDAALEIPSAKKPRGS
ncbi:MAG: hypothetical protein HY290_17685 [Planctomycetia bacterium]|nr:hypothetical protein [Planctomycetia bacterium]